MVLALDWQQAEETVWTILQQLHMQCGKSHLERKRGVLCFPVGHRLVYEDSNHNEGQ